MKLLSVILFAVTVLSSAQAQMAEKIYDSTTQNGPCVIAKIEGERIPFPLRKANTKFELAENETYLLNGTIVTMAGHSYFRVDFQTQPWLSTEKMLQNPYFPIDEATISVGQLNGRLVQMAVIAHKNDSSSQVEGGASNLKIVPILPPVPFGY